MRRLTLLTAAFLAACVHAAPTAGGAPPLEISEDGHLVVAGAERWSAPEPLSFFQRGDVLQVVSTAPNGAWVVAVPFGADGRLAWPAEAPFAARDGQLHLRAAKASPAIAALVDAGQLYPHDDHYHLTHALQDGDWQALYADRSDTSTLPPLRRQVAATILAFLLDERLPGTPAEATEAALRRMHAIIAKARRAVEGDVTARAIESIIAHDFEIRDDGRTVEVEGKVFRAVEPIRFEYCSGHFHVGDAAGKWAQVVEFDGGPGGAFAWPTSIFFELRGDGAVAERATTARWRRLVDAGQIHFVRDHWHVTERYANPRLKLLLTTIEDAKVPERLRDHARALALDVMRLRLDVGTEAEFDSRLAAIDVAIDRAATALEGELRGGATPAR